MADNFLQIENVCKAFATVVALNQVSLNVPRGCVYGLLGPNGAGKSTLIRIINQISRPDSGTILFDGHPLQPSDVTRIGYLPEERGLYKKMRVDDQIIYLARLKGMTKADAVTAMNMWLERFSLSDRARHKVETLSKGNQQKVQFIATVIHRPELLIFDEPFSGFDPVNAELLKQEILQLRDQGHTILFSTHNMQSVEQVCEHITLINSSQVVLQGSVDQVRNSFRHNRYHLSLSTGSLPTQPELYTIIEAEKAGQYQISPAKGIEINQILSQLISQGVQLSSFQEIIPGMDEIFIQTVQQRQTGTAL